MPSMRISIEGMLVYRQGEERGEMQQSCVRAFVHVDPTGV